jgi:hypothetical protein
VITNCSYCQKLFETRSEEYANEPDRLCPECNWSLPALRFDTEKTNTEEIPYDS